MCVLHVPRFSEIVGFLVCAQFLRDPHDGIGQSRVFELCSLQIDFFLVLHFAYAGTKLEKKGSSKAAPGISFRLDIEVKSGDILGPT